MKLRSVLPMRVAKYGYVLISLVFCVAGALIVLLPTPEMSSIAIFFGVTMLVFGMIKLIGYFSKDLFRLAFQYDLEFGILLSILGIIVLIKHQNAVEFICIAYGISMMADGLFKMRIAFDAKRFGIRQWWLTLVLAILSGCVGILVVLCPMLAIEVGKLLLGISCITEGLLNLSVALSMVKIINHQQPDIIDIEIEG